MLPAAGVHHRSLAPWRPQSRSQEAGTAHGQNMPGEPRCQPPPGGVLAAATVGSCATPTGQTCLGTPLHALAVGCGPADPTLVGTQKGLGPGGGADPGYHRKALLKAGRGRKRRKRSPDQDQGQSLPCLATHATHSCDCSCHLHG